MVRCADCGFLAFRNPDTHDLEEVGEETRKTGGFRVFQREREGARPFYVTTGPRCFVMRHDLPAEVKEAAEQIPQESRDYTAINLPVLQRERVCDGWCRWNQGFSPKEHKEMLLNLEGRILESRERQRDRWWLVGATLAGAAVGFIAAIGAAALTILYTQKEEKPTPPPTIIVRPVEPAPSGATMPPAK